MNLNESLPHSHAMPNIQQALAILTEQLTIPDWAAKDTDQKTGWESVSPRPSQINAWPKSA